MSIPKIIHYCWFGKNPKSEKILRCMESWRQNLPDYTVVEWNEENCDIAACKWTQGAYGAGKWAFVADYFRFKALYEQGGIYLDTDMLVHRPFDEFLQYSAFFSMECFEWVSGGAIGAVPECEITGKMISIYDTLSFKSDFNYLSSMTVPRLITKTLIDEYGYKQTGYTQFLSTPHGDAPENIAVYSPNVFIINVDDGENYSEHLYSSDVSWLNEAVQYSTGKTAKFHILFRYFYNLMDRPSKRSDSQPASESSNAGMAEQTKELISVVKDAIGYLKVNPGNNEITAAGINEGIAAVAAQTGAVAPPLLEDENSDFTEAENWLDQVLSQVSLHGNKAGDSHIKIGEFSSGDFWENNYASGGISGAGSYGRLAQFKAETVNGLISEFKINSLIDFGCGDGNQLAMFNVQRYVGVDASRTVIDRHNRKYADDPSKSFYHLSQRESYINAKYDASLSHDVIYHLLEQDVFEKYMDDLFNCSSDIVIIYSSNHESYTPWPEFRHRNFTHYAQNAHPEFELIRYIPNKYPYIIGYEVDTSASDYYIFQRK